MSNEVLTWEVFHSWDGPTLKANMANPKIRPEIERVIAEKAIQVSQRLEQQNSFVSEQQVARAEAQRQHEAEARLAQEEAKIEAERLVRMTPAERQAERERNEAAQRELQESERRAEIQKKKDADYLAGGDIDSRLSKTQVDEIRATRRQEIADRDSAILALQEAEASAATGPTPEEVAAAEKIAVDKAAAEAAAADVEKKALEEAAHIAAEEAAAPKKKLIEDFQVVDGDGNPIGRRTHLEADTEQEMREKMRTSYTEAVRYAERQKKKKAQMVAFTPLPLLSTLTQEEQAALQADLNGADEVKKALAETKLAADELKAQTNESRKQAEYNRQGFESNKFMQNHIEDFKPCDANAGLLAEYFTKNNLYWSADNLEIAFDDEALRSRLVKPEQRFVAVDPAIAIAEEKTRLEAEFKARVDAAVQATLTAEAEAKKKIEQDAAAAITAAASASGAAAASASATPPAEKTLSTNTPSVTARKLPAAGIEPGSLHGGRPTTSTTKSNQETKTPSQIKQEIARMMSTPEGRLSYRKKLRDDPKFRAYLNAGGIKA